MDKYDLVIVSGGFDPVHVGHVRMFEAAKALGKRLFCGVNSDDWLTRKKGKPFMKCAERMEILMAIRAIDYALPFDDSDGTAESG